MKKNNYWVFKPESFKTRMNKIQTVLDSVNREDIDSLHVIISRGNRKTGIIPSVSLIPVKDCVNCKICSRSCYDLRNDMIYQESVRSRCINSLLAHCARERYFAEIDAFLDIHYPRAFRFHIGGDILDMDYLERMAWLVKKYTDIKFLAFTKNFSVCNAWFDKNGSFPENLHIIFSGWLGIKMPNPYNLPTSHPLFGDKTSAPDGAKLCTGNCTVCLKENKLCWNLNYGDAVVFPAH